MSDTVDFVGDSDDHALSLVYVKLHRDVVDVFVEREFSATTIKVYLYLCFNALVHQGVSFRFEIDDIADFLGRKVRVIYRALAELEKAKLIRIRRGGGMVCDLPYVTLAQIEGSQRGRGNRDYKEQQAFNSEVHKHEMILGRAMTDSEKQRLRKYLDTQAERAALDAE